MNNLLWLIAVQVVEELIASEEIKRVEVGRPCAPAPAALVLPVHLSID